MTSVGNETSSSSSSSVVNPTNVLVLSNILYPVLNQLNYEDISSDLRKTFFQLEEIYPGFTRNFLQLFLDRQYSSRINLHQLTLQLEKSLDKSSYYLSTVHRENDFHQLNICSKNLKQILSRIPDDIKEKRLFLETIKQIASAIKKTLDSLSNIYQYLPNLDSRQALENEKKQFIKSSKYFSNTLKSYFADNQSDEVFIAANYLLIQTEYLLRTIKFHCEPETIDPYAYPLLSQYEHQRKVRQSIRNSKQSSASSSQGNYS